MRVSGVRRTLARRRHVSFPVDRYLWNVHKGFVYCPIPKNANTSMKLWFLHTLDIDTSALQPGEVHVRLRKQHTLAGLSSRRAERILDRSLTFVVVRNPWTRIVSGYVDKFVKQAPLNHASRHAVNGFKRQLGRDSQQADHLRGLSFHEFVDYLCAAPDNALNAHWKPQHLFVDGRRFDVEVRFERLEVEMAALNARLGVDGPVPRSNITPYAELSASGDLADVPACDLRSLTGLPKESALLTPELCERLADRYRHDVDRFGYAGERPSA